MDDNKTIQLSLALSPQGSVYLDRSAHSKESLPNDLVEDISELFLRDDQVGLLHLGLCNFSKPLPPSFAFWQQYARFFVVELCKRHDSSEPANDLDVPMPSWQDLQGFIEQSPFMNGSEYLCRESLEKIWKDLLSCIVAEIKSFGGTLESFLKHYNPSLINVGKVCLHLAENKGNDTYPFAFIATYTSRLSCNAKLQHIPLGKALQDHAGKQNKAVLLKLLLPLQKASQQSEFVKNLVDSNEIFNPQLWNARQAHHFLTAIPVLEDCGLIVRIPNWWNPKKPTCPQVKVTIGNDKKNRLGFDAIIDCDVQLALSNGEKLTDAEWNELFSSAENFVKIKGQWVEVDQKKLQSVLAHWKEVQNQVKSGALNFADGLRLVAGFSKNNGSQAQADNAVTAWSDVRAGAWLNDILSTLRNPQANVYTDIFLILEKSLAAQLRPYQCAGVQWLWLLYNLKLGGCLADDMGLGKTIQVLSLLLLIKQSDQYNSLSAKTLLIVPASILGNWQEEILRFAPSLHFLIIHSSAGEMDQITQEQISSVDLIITTYAFFQKVPLLCELSWNLVILDEAQMIKNHSTNQARMTKILKSNMRIALTGTPIENNVGDLWSLFDFIAPGLLGLRKVFINHEMNSHFYVALRALVGPYILRRLKSDSTIIKDLPDKTEINAYCLLSKRQAIFYQQVVNELEEKLKSAEGIQRRGLVLANILRLKQVCNHPDQFLGYGDYATESSGKFLRLQEIAEQVAAKQEKMLVFTQFCEIIPALSEFLGKIFGHEGLILHGQTDVTLRSERVKLFQQERGPQFFILSIRAGGTGLNLTAASHVIHFDRWWNPAVENQATDRAYRIGQNKNVLVHKFICRGTIEEKIDELITSKKSLAKEIISDQNEVNLTKLSNEELIKIVSLDLSQIINNG